MGLGSLKELTDYVLQTAGMSGARRPLAEEWVNSAHQDVCEAYDWRELKKEGTFNTVAPYKTGTVSTSGTAVTGVGTTFASGMTGRKFAAGYGKPWFLIDTFSSTTSIALDTSWPFTDLSGDTYVIYEDVYSLASDVDKIDTQLVHLYDDEGHQLGRLTQAQFQERRDFPESAGKPDWFTLVENDSKGYLQMQIGGRAPDAVYVVKYHYKVKHIEMKKGGDQPQLRDTLLETVAAGALIRAYETPEFTGSGLAEKQEGKFNRMLAQKIKRAKREKSRGVQPRTIAPDSRGYYPFSLPVGSE